MKAEEAKRLADIATDVAHAGAALAMTGFRSGTRFDRKQGTELVTQFDFEVEALVRSQLQVRSPDTQIVAEEGGGTVGEKVWYVDPIDGTTNFAHGHPFWAVSIGLVVRGRPIVGVVVAPALSITWAGWMGGPALRNGEPCHVSSIRALADALLATGFPYDRQTSPDNNLDAFGALQKKAVGIRRCGSAAIDLCLVSDGTYDGYWEKKLRPWDIAAGLAIVHAAGGTTTSMDGAPPVLADGNVVASNGLVHDALVRELRASRAR